MAEPKEPPPFVCALAELLEAGVSTDMRPAVEFMCDDPANLGECFAQLPAAAQEQLSGFLPVDDRGDPRLLRHLALAETLGLFRELLSAYSSAISLSLICLALVAADAVVVDFDLLHVSVVESLICFV